MEVLRENRGTLLAMLEAFLYDPLLHWTVCLRASSALVSLLKSPGEQHLIYGKQAGAEQRQARSERSWSAGTVRPAQPATHHAQPHSERGACLYAKRRGLGRVPPDR